MRTQEEIRNTYALSCDMLARLPTSQERQYVLVLAALLAWVLAESDGTPEMCSRNEVTEVLFDTFRKRIAEAEAA